MDMLQMQIGKPVYGESAGWLEHHAWKFVVSGVESGAIHTGTYRAGMEAGSLAGIKKLVAASEV